MKVLESFENEGRSFRFAALIPVYPWPSTSYILLLDGDWLDEMSVFEAIDIVVPRIHQVIKQPGIRGKINRVNIWLKGPMYERGIEAEILIDKIGLSRYFNYPLASSAVTGSSGEEILASFLPQN